jgi:hypothetical protein
MAFTKIGLPLIPLMNGVIPDDSFVTAVESVNDALKQASVPIENISLDLYNIIDLRMLSGLIGEMFSSELCSCLPQLRKNPNIDGYPDLLDLSSESARIAINNCKSEDFIKFPFGGLEVKNTFGVKKSKVAIPARATRLHHIQTTLVWKAHHRETNNLIGLQSDYIDGIPQIIAFYHSNKLEQSDWTVKQQPRPGSTMTSFCQTQSSGYKKMRDGLRFFMPGIGMEQFLGLTK